MNLTTTQAQGRVPVTVVGIEGELDGSNFQQLINTARDMYKAGARHLLLDMSKMTYMSSAGLVALHSTALLMRGEEPPSPEHGWGAFHAITRDQATGRVHQAVKLLSPQPRVEKTLTMTGLKEFFEVHTDLSAAVASF